MRIRLRRQAVGLIQQQLAELIGTSYQQVHKYEKGTDRVTAGQLYAIALVLGTDVAFFFEPIEPEFVDAGRPDDQNRLVELLRNVQRIGSTERRQAVCALAKALASLDDLQAEPA